MRSALDEDKTAGHRDTAPPTEAKLTKDDDYCGDRLAAIVIPAHLDSIRLPNKPLLNAGGRPVIAYTIGNALKSKRAADVGVITPNQQIFKAVGKLFPSKMLNHISVKPSPTGSRRVGYWLDQFDGWDTFSVVVNLQCDEPCIDSRDLDNLIAACQVSDEICTLVTALPEHLERDPNSVKAWTRGNVLRDFSRAMLSNHPRDSARLHCGVYAVPKRWYRAVFKDRRSLRAESMSLEQLTWVDGGLKILAVDLKHTVDPISVNTREDFTRFCERVNAGARA